MNALDHTAARQLVADPAAESDAVLMGQGGQPQLVQHAPNASYKDMAKVYVDNVGGNCQGTSSFAQLGDVYFRAPSVG